MEFSHKYWILRLVFFCYHCISQNAASGDGLHHQELREQDQPRRRLQRTETDVTGAARMAMEGPSNPHLLFYGRLKDDIGEPVEGAQVQFWHADANGNYFHPGDDLDGYEYMKDSFSYFGTATTDEDGSFEFKTYRPGIYISRPITHIHFKVFNEGQELLTSQFYFGDEFVWFDEMLILRLEESIDDDGNVYYHTSKDVVVNMNKGGYKKLTPWQVEGPFYPLVDFFDVSSDMTIGLLRRFYDSSPTQKPSSTPSQTKKPSSTPSQKEVDALEDFIDYLEGTNATEDGNSTVNFIYDTDVKEDGSETLNSILGIDVDDDDEEDEEEEDEGQFVDILLDDEILPIDPIDDGDGDGELSIANNVHELHVPSLGENFTSADLEETTSTTRENERKPILEYREKANQRQQYDKDDENSVAENFAFRFINSVQSKFDSETENDAQQKNNEEDSDNTPASDRTRFLRSRDEKEADERNRR